jgi:shikimate dehydrogenase
VGLSATVLAHDALAPDAPLRDALRAATLVVNTTPIGLRDATHPVPAECLAAPTAVLDLVYRSGETAWVRACRARGLAAQDGLRMLVEQGAHAYQWWFGDAPDRKAMWRVLEARPTAGGTP